MSGTTVVITREETGCCKKNKCFSTQQVEDLLKKEFEYRTLPCINEYDPVFIIHEHDLLSIREFIKAKDSTLNLLFRPYLWPEVGAQLKLFEQQTKTSTQLSEAQSQ